MLRIDAVSEKTARNARQSLQQLIAERNTSKNESLSSIESVAATKPELSSPIHRQPYEILIGTMELYVAGEEIMNNLKSQPSEGLRSFSKQVGISPEDFRPGKGVRFVPFEGEPIRLSRSARGRVWGILAFSHLRSCLPYMEDYMERASLTAEENSAELLPGQVMFYDGDESLTWKCAEEGFGLFLSASKSSPEVTVKSRNDGTSQDSALSFGKHQ